MYQILRTSKFKKSWKLAEKRGLPLEKAREVIRILAETGSLPSIYRPHKLSGRYVGCWECHIQADWLLVWEQYDKSLTLLLLDTGTHSDIFGI